MIPYQMIYRVIGLCLLIFAPFTESKKVHELMTEDEILKVFHTTPDKVPDYEIVPLEHSLYKRSTPQDFRLKFKAFDKDVDIYLNPNEGILVGEETPVWIGEYFGGSVNYRQLKQGIMKEVLGVYQSVPGRAALVVRTRNEKDLQFDGTIEDLSVIPLPSRLHQEIEKIDKKKRDLYRTSRSMMITEYHIVFKTNTGDSKNNTAQENNEDSSNQSDVIRSKRGDKVVFPTILVTTDFDIAVKSNDDSEYYDQIIYQLAFWNGVDLKYRKLTNPRVRLRIAGFIIGSGRIGTPYVKKHIVNGEVEIYPAIDDMRIYWDKMRAYGKFSSDAFHIVTTATKKLIRIKNYPQRSLKLVGRDPKTGEHLVYGGLTGIASICNEYGDKFRASILFTDNRSFGDINVAVHELGHVLGAVHDDPTRNTCLPEDGYLMAPYTSSTQNNPKWSNCSLEAMSRTLGNKFCIDKPKNKYPPGEPLGKILPGTLKTDHEQCQARGFDWACDPTENICRVLRCYYTGFYGFFTTLLKCQDSPSAAEGTECAPGKGLLNQSCTVKNILKINICTGSSFADTVCMDGECKSLF